MRQLILYQLELAKNQLAKHHKYKLKSDSLHSKQATQPVNKFMIGKFSIYVNVEETEGSDVSIPETRTKPI